MIYFSSVQPLLNKIHSDSNSLVTKVTNIQDKYCVDKYRTLWLQRLSIRKKENLCMA